MPGNILNADTGFPTFAEGEDSNAKIDKVMNYLYMLLEQLRYSLANLDADNFNETGLREIGEGIARPLQTSFENEFGKTNALIEGWSNEYGSQIKLLTEWKGTASQSISSLTQKADANAASITLLNQWKGETSSSLAVVQTKADQNEADITFLTSWQNTVEDDLEGLSSSVAYIEEIADENGASISQIVKAVGKNGEVNAASIVAAVNAAGSSVKIDADHVNISGFVTFESLENDGESTINGNNISLVSDSDGESISKISFYHNEMYGDPDYEIGTIFLTDDYDWGYSLCVHANSFRRSSSRYADASLLLRGEGGVNIASVTADIGLSSGEGISMYGQTYCDIGAGYSGVRIHADSEYRDTINSEPGPNTFIFVNGGLYYIDENEDPHEIWEL